jgi:hypothetical protein
MRKILSSFYQCEKEKTYVVLVQLEQPRQNKNHLYRHEKPINIPRKDPFHLYSLRPCIHLSFNSLQGSPLSRVSCKNIGIYGTEAVGIGREHVSASAQKISGFWKNGSVGDS